MGNKQEEVENVMQLEIYDLIALTETWWDELQNENIPWAPRFQKDRLGRGGRGREELLLFMLRNWMDWEDLPLSDSCEQVKDLWMKMKARTNKGQSSAGVFNGCLTRGSLFMRLLASDKGSITLISSHPDRAFQPPGCLLGKHYSRLQGY